MTAAGQRYPLPAPFFVLATQNPIEQEGTYPFPAQLDRFMFNTWVDYPSFDEEVNVVKQTTSDGPRMSARSSAATRSSPTSKSSAACRWPTTWSTTPSTLPLPPARAGTARRPK